MEASLPRAYSPNTRGAPRRAGGGSGLDQEASGEARGRASPISELGSEPCSAEDVQAWPSLGEAWGLRIGRLGEERLASSAKWLPQPSALP